MTAKICHIPQKHHCVYGKFGVPLDHELLNFFNFLAYASLSSYPPFSSFLVRLW